MFQYDYPHPAVTTDIVIFTVKDNDLHLLLIKRGENPFKGEWALPGGFLQIDESLEQCAERELMEETGVSSVYLEQLYTFGTVERDPRERVISVAYFALIPSDKLKLKADTDAEEVEWFKYNKLPKLAFDHKKIIEAAYARIKDKLSYSTIAFQLMPKEFTLTEIQSVYESILHEELDKRNFRKLIHGLGVLKETNKTKKEGAHRPAKLFQLKKASEILIFR